jgi:hypothetical protein
VRVGGCANLGFVDFDLVSHFDSRSEFIYTYILRKLFCELLNLNAGCLVNPNTLEPEKSFVFVGIFTVCGWANLGPRTVLLDSDSGFMISVADLVRSSFLASVIVLPRDKYIPKPADEVHIDPVVVAPTQEGTAPELGKTKSEEKPELAKFVKEDSGIFMKSDGVEGDTAENSLTEVALPHL